MHRSQEGARAAGTKERRRIAARLRLMAIGLAYVLLFDWTYSRVVYPQFHYMGFGLAELPTVELVGLWALAVAPTAWMPTTRRPSLVAYWVLYLWVLIPSILIPAYTEVHVPGGTFVLAMTLVAAFAGIGLIYRLPVLEFQARARASRGRLNLVLSALSIAALYVFVIQRFGFQVRLPAVLEVYDVRLEYSDDLRERGRFVAYAVLWLGKVVNPLLIALGISRRQPALLATGLVGQAMLFSVTGHKSLVAVILFIPLLVLVAQKVKGNLGAWLALGSGFVIIASIAESQILDSNYLNHLVVRRLFMLPGLLTGYYFEFFSSHPKAMLSHSILQGLVTAQYDLAPPDLIGQAYFAVRTHSNANIWADAFANFGYVGVILFSAGFALLLWVFDGLAKNLDFPVAAALIAMPAFSLTNSALLTTVLSHGMGLAVLLALPLSRRVGHASGSPPSAKRRPVPPYPRANSGTLRGSRPR